MGLIKNVSRGGPRLVWAGFKKRILSDIDLGLI